jgi:hypothetical protein
MFFPKLSDQQIAWVVQQVAGYIEQQRQIYRGAAVPLDGRQTAAMQRFFPASTLDSTRSVLLNAANCIKPSAPVGSYSSLCIEIPFCEGRFMEKLFEEFLAFLESEATHWDNAARCCEQYAAKLPPDKAELQLMGAVYRELAQLNRGRAATMRQRGISSYQSDAG